jgi:ribonuclease E
LGKKTMLINATDPEEIRVATLVDGVLTDFDIEFIHNEKIKGNIYKAKVVRVDQSLQAAFVHYGGQKNGFLPIGELPKDLVSGDGRRGRIQDLLNRDQEVMVQAVREELGSKGAMMTGQISLPGRYLVLTPGSPVNGISRKIESREEREYFKRLVDEMDIPKGHGVIVRTASMGVTKEDFQRDLEYLLDTWKEVQNRYKHRHGPGLAWQEDDVVTRTLRDGFSADMEEVHIDDLDTFQAAQHFFRRTMPQHLNVLKHYTGKKPLFSKSQTEDQIDRIYARKVNLPSGGALVLDQTEALVAIDVNSGRTSGDGVEDMAFRTNMEAAEEAARQLRLRDLAGLVAIDFIDMKRESHIKAVQDRLVECLREDKARMEVGKINRFGVLIMTRQRIRPSIHHVTHESCPTCQGLGKVKNLDSMVLSVTRRIKAMLSRDDLKELRIKLAPAIAMGVLNAKRRELADLEELGEVQIRIEADASVPYGEMVAELERAEEEVAEKAAPQAKPRPKDREEDTVVLGGDSPITFDDALGTDDAARPAEKRAWGGASRPAHGALAGEDKPKAKPVEIKYDRRDAQRAALEERERLRALFESAMPVEDAEGTPEAAAEAEPRTEPAGGGKSRNRRGRGKSAAKAAGSGEAVPVMEPQPPVQVADTPMPEPPKVTPDILASLVVPVHRPKKLAPAEVAPAAAEAAAQRSATKAKPAKPAARAKAPAAAAPEPANEAGKAKPAKPPAKPAKPAADAAASKPRKKASKP